MYSWQPYIASACQTPFAMMFRLFTTNNREKTTAGWLIMTLHILKLRPRVAAVPNNPYNIQYPCRFFSFMFLASSPGNN